MAEGGEVGDLGPENGVRVLLVIKCLGHGGAERLLVDTVASRDRRSFAYQVAFILQSQDALVPAVEAAETPVHNLGARNNLDVRWMPRLRRLLLAEQFDVVHFHLPYAAALGRLVVASLPRAKRPPIVYTEHSLWNRMALAVKVLNRATIGMDEALVVVSEPARDSLPRTLKQRARVVVHGVDVSRAGALIDRRRQLRERLRDELQTPEDHVLVVTVANLRPEKGYDVLLEAAQEVLERGLPVRFAAIGRGPLAEALAARHRALALGPRFAFLGQRDDVLEVLAGADVFVLASHHEGLPVAIMEATSLGLAVVATAVGGVPHVLTDGVDALIVPPGRPDALADALERMCCDPELRLRLGQAARTRSAVFDVAKATRQIEDIYREILGARA